MKTICVECKTVMVEGPLSPRGTPSGGLCSDCFAKFLRQVAQMTQDLRKLELQGASKCEHVEDLWRNDA